MKSSVLRAALSLDDGTDVVLGETSTVLLREIGGKAAGRQALEVVEGQADVGRIRPARPDASGEIEVIVGGTRATSRPGEGGSQLRADHLDGHVAVVLQFVRAVEVRHATAADLSAEVVSGRKRGPQAVDHALYAGTHGTSRGAERNAADLRVGESYITDRDWRVNFAQTAPLQ
jgi:hypothetical protein